MDDVTRRQIAEAEAARAEAERDIVATVAVNEAVHRAAAEDSAVKANVRANEAESFARSNATSANLAHQAAAYERASASNTSFVAVLIGIVLVGVVFALAYFMWWGPSRETATNTVIQRTERTNTVMPSQSSPPVVNVQPPDVNVNIQTPPPAEPPKEEAPAPADSGSAPAPPAGEGAASSP